MIEQPIQLQVKLDRKEILRYLGFRENQTILTEEISQLVDGCMEEARELLYPAAVYKTFSIGDLQSDKVLIPEAEIAIVSKDIVCLLKNCHLVTFMAVTVGKEVDRIIERLFLKGEYAKASIFDAIGSDSVEQAANDLNKMLGEEAGHKGYTLTERFSPGYGDLDLSYQPAWLKILEANRISLTVSRSNMLIPRKSITALMGWTKGPNRLLQDDIEHKCEVCNLEECKYRPMER